MIHNKTILYSLAITLLALPVTVYLSLRPQDIRQMASENRLASTAQNNLADKKPEYKKGEMLVILRQDISESIQHNGVNSMSVAELEAQPDQKSVDVGRLLKSVGASKIERKNLKGSDNRSLSYKSSNNAKGIKDIYKLYFSEDSDIFSLSQELVQDPIVEIAEPNYIYKTQLAPNDPYYQDTYPTNVSSRDPNWNPSYDYQWDMKKINMEPAWDFASNSAQVIVAVIDTGVDYAHPELGACTIDQVNNNQCSKILPGYDFINNDNDPLDDNGHGTHVTGTIAAFSNNSTGISGMGQNVKIMPIKGLDSTGTGSLDQLAEGVYYAVFNGAKVINASWGGIGKSQILQTSISYAYSRNVVFVAAAGNNSMDVSMFFPAAFTCTTPSNPFVDCTITVSSVDQNDNLSSFSNWGNGIDVSSPGGDESGNVLSLLSQIHEARFDSNKVGDKYLRISGTSMAAPHVAGLAALILSKNPAYTPTQVENIIVNSSEDLGEAGFDWNYGYGRINAKKALEENNTSTPLFAIISEPTDNSYFKNLIEIKGSVGGSDFSSFSVEYSQDQSTWISSEITYTYSQRIPIISGILATLNTTNLKDGKYYLRVKVLSLSGKIFYYQISFNIEKTLRDNFPIHFGSIWTQRPVIEDINGDGKREIIFVNNTTDLLIVIEPDGSSLAGWPQIINDANPPPDPNATANIFSVTPLILDLDTNYPGFEIVVPIRKGLLNQITALLAFHADGTPVSSWGFYDNQPKMYKTIIPIAGSSMNNKPIIIVVEHSTFGLGGQPNLHVLDNKAQEITGWPKSLETLSTHLLSVSDLDGDNIPEIVIDYFKSIRIYSIDGSLKKQINVPDIVKHLGIADINGDGFSDIVAVIGDYKSINRSVYVWDKYGNILSSKWPYKYTENSIKDYTYFNLGDYNNDKKIDIAFNKSGGIHILDYSANLLRGFPYFPNFIARTAPNFASNVTLENNNHLWLFSDFYADPYNFYAYEYNPYSGENLSALSFPKILNGIPGFPTIADLDNDSKIELVVTSNLQLYVFDLNYTASRLDWPQAFQNPQHTNAIPVPSLLPVIVSASVIDSTSLWKVTLTGTNLSSSYKARLYDGLASSNIVWKDNIYISVSSDKSSATFSLPSNSPPSKCNIGKVCQIDVVLFDSTKNIQIKPFSITLPQVNVSSPTPTKSVATPTPTQGADTTPPTVKITYPTNGMVISPTSSGINIDTQASDPSGISQLTIFVDGVAKKLCGPSNGTLYCKYYWSTQSLPSGQHTIKVTASDRAVPLVNVGVVTITVTK